MEHLHSNTSKLYKRYGSPPVVDFNANESACSGIPKKVREQLVKIREHWKVICQNYQIEVELGERQNLMQSLRVHMVSHHDET